jgi:hypothetical protein
MVNPTSPAKAESGLIEPIVGTGESVPEMVKRREFETPPPGDGLMTVIAAVPAVAISPADIDAVTWVGLIRVVVRLPPFHLTIESLMKPDPLTVRVKEVPPAATVVGTRLLSAGSGLGAVTVKVAPFEISPPGAGLATVTLKVPAVARSAAPMLAVSLLALTNVVARTIPFHRICDPATKLAPLTVRVKAALFWGADAGERLRISGRELSVRNMYAAPEFSARLSAPLALIPATALSSSEAPTTTVLIETPTANPKLSNPPLLPDFRYPPWLHDVPERVKR